MKKIRIGNSSGFWGDAPNALSQITKSKEIDYVTSDYLAELSMCIIRKQQRKNPQQGYVTDFISHFKSAFHNLWSNNIKLITNAGGNNPKALGYELKKILQTEGIKMKVVVIEGDNITELTKKRNQFKFDHFDTGKPLLQELNSANAYIGVPAILKALELNADIVVTGRVTDSALALAPMIHHFKWSLHDYDRLAAGMIAAHCIECGTQVCGGNFTDWKKIINWSNIGFPIVEVEENGDFIVTKQDNTGGLVSIDTVREQLLYEIKDPSLYYSPDVIADLSNLKLSSIREDAVLVQGAKGQEPTDHYKVSASYYDGFRATGSLIISGSDAIEKANLFAEIFWEKLSMKFYRSNTEYVGYNSTSTSHKIISDEVLLRFHVHDHDKSKVKHFVDYLASMVLAGPQGVSIIGGRPRIQEVFAYWPSLIPKNKVKIIITEIDLKKEYLIKPPLTSTKILQPKSDHTKQTSYELPNQGLVVPLYKICLARSGDKGDNVNIGVAARSLLSYNFLKKHLTPRLLKTWFGDFVKGEISRYELPGILSFNFFLEYALDGGGTQSLRIDTQGKTYAANLLTQQIRVPFHILDDL
jgi:hypothetical protein